MTNNASLAVSKFFGFGLMDAGMMVYLAKSWKRVPPQVRCEVTGRDKNRFVFSLVHFFLGVLLLENSPYNYG